MRLSVKAVMLSLVPILLPTTVIAGPLYGTIREGNNPLGLKKIEVACPDFEKALDKDKAKAETDKSGSFRINVNARGRCVFRIESGRSSPQFYEAIVYSSDNPIRYNFEVEKGSLRRR